MSVNVNRPKLVRKNLVNDASHLYTAGNNPLQDQYLLWIKDWIELHTGINFPDHKLPLLGQRLNTLCIRMSIKSFEELVHAIENSKSPTILRQVIEVATTNHTHFFRELGTLHYFLESIIPSFAPTQQMRIWSAAASSGEELYTIIMLMGKKMGLPAVKNRFSFLGTDVNSNVIEQAEKAVYSSHRLTEVPAEEKQRWFRAIGLDNWALSNDITDLCLFRTLNLLDKSWPFANLFHVVFLRNVLYYFQPQTQEKILKQIYEVTLPGGWLITSVTETLNSLKVDWKRVEAGVYRKM